MPVISYGVFDCEHLGFDARTVEQIEKIKVKHSDAINLEVFLKKYAASEEVHHTNRTYLVKDKSTGEIACYFSLRNGLFTLNMGLENFATIPAIELSNFAVNELYKQKYPNTRKIGIMVFNEFILPLIHQAQEISGIQALYIYALPNDKLMEHYTSLGFTRLDAEEAFIHKHVKPKYDEGCIFMCQGV